MPTTVVFIKQGQVARKGNKEVKMSSPFLQAVTKEQLLAFHVLVFR